MQVTQGFESMSRQLASMASALFLVAAMAGCGRIEHGRADVQKLNPGNGGTPKVFVEHPIYEFGTMGVGEKGRHVFVVNNTGTAPLTLEVQSTTCKCTLAELETEVIEPGGSAEIELEWNGEHRQERFRHGARLRTNDPESSTIDLAVEGRIRTKLGVWPETVHFGDVDRNKEHKLEHLAVYSQVFEKLKVRSITTDSPNAVVLFAYGPGEFDAPEKSQFVRGLKLKYRAGAKAGPFSGTVRLVCEVPPQLGEAAEELILEFGFTGTVVGDMSLHGRDVVGRAVIFGTVSQKLGAHRTVYLHARNGVAEGIDFSLGDIKPEFLKVRLGARQKLSEQVSRFPVELEVPPGAPEVNMINVQLGRVHICTTHPEYPAITFDVSLAVIR